MGFLIVFIGGGIGAALRHGVNLAMPRLVGTAFPYATMFENVTGSIVMGALAGILGSMMALEAIREIVGFGDSLVGRLVMVDARAMRFETLRYARDPANPLNGDAPTITDLSAHTT